MAIEPKYKIGDVLQRTLSRHTNWKLTALQVMEIITQTCYAGTQIFYLCRVIHIQLSKRHDFDADRQAEWIVGHGVSNSNGGWGVQKYREDELEAADKKVLEIINNKS